MAMQRSERLWQKTVMQRHQYMERFGDVGFFPAVNGETFYAYPYNIWDLIPASFNCPVDIERIGRIGDGGKWVCGMSRYETTTKPCIVYSFGIQNESSFEQELLSRTHCRLWGYDYSVEDFGPILDNLNREKATFMQAGIAGKSNPTGHPPFYSILDLMSMNGHEYIDLLKIDIEFAEFEALAAMEKALPPDRQFPIGQILIELHLSQPSGITPTKFLAWWENLEKRGLRPAWTEPNFMVVTLRAEDSMPRCAEYTLLNAKDHRNIIYN
ncbi:methyltransferase domain-containing protein [Xylogone sp. PMI_703]|nr:methyltransferase domain-containing protein [Xylogone sp. PMI_703]